MREKEQSFNPAAKPMQVWNVNADNIVISKLVITKIDSKYLTGNLDKTVKPLVLIMTKMS